MFRVTATCSHALLRESLASVTKPNRREESSLRSGRIVCLSVFLEESGVTPERGALKYLDPPVHQEAPWRPYYVRCTPHRKNKHINRTASKLHRRSKAIRRSYGDERATPPTDRFSFRPTVADGSRHRHTYVRIGRIGIPSLVPPKIVGVSKI